jgi:predicted ATP-grasp superfamily ATP-dependent carboligase
MTGVQTARILAGHGVPVIAIAGNPEHYCAKTRVCERILAADIKSEAFIESLESLGPSLPQKAVLVPCTDMSVLLISRNRQRLLEWYHVSLPDEAVVEMLMDKISFVTFAQEQGLAIPGTFFIRNRNDAEEAARQLSYPCILKPPMKTPLWEQNTKEKVFKIDSAAEFLRIYDRCAGWAELLMAQEWVEGSDANLYSCNCYFNADSEPLVTFIARKIRQWPPETGTSCLGEEVRNDEVLEESIRLFRSVGYHGLGYVELKQDERSGKHYIIEPNIGRPTGRSAIAEAGGVELVYTMYCDAIQRQIPENRIQQYKGVKWIHIRRDFQSALFYYRRGDLSLGEWLRSWRGKKGYAVFAWNDLAPFWHDWKRAIGLAFSGRSKKKSLNGAGVDQEAIQGM